LAVLDGIEQLPASSLATLQQLVQDREVSLPNGSRLMDLERFDALVARESARAGGNGAFTIFAVNLPAFTGKFTTYHSLTFLC
jgi:hypothetical protein